MTESNRQRLARLMDERRQDLRLTWEVVAQRAGMSREGLRRTREGERAMRVLTKRGIEDALYWAPGSVDAVLDGGEPTPIPRTVTGQASAPLTFEATARGETVSGQMDATLPALGGQVTGEVELTIEERLALIDHARDLLQQARELGRRRTPEEELRRKLRALQQVLSEVVADMNEVDERLREREAS